MQNNEELIETKTYEVHQLKCMLVVLLIWGLGSINLVLGLWVIAVVHCEA